MGHYLKGVTVGPEWLCSATNRGAGVICSNSLLEGSVVIQYIQEVTDLCLGARPAVVHAAIILLEALCLLNTDGVHFVGGQCKL